MANALVRASLLSAQLIALASAATALADHRPDGRGGGSFDPPTDSISPATYRRIEEAIDRNLALLDLPAPATEGTPAFAWPLAANGVGYFALDAIASYVDHDDDVGELLDYACGARTYDTPDGYDHRGVDIYPWPYGWRAMDLDLVRIVAAAPGTIVAKDDGNFDRNCVCLTDDPNHVIVEHADGSRAWYLHLRNGSVTPKGIGESVATGEILGTIGSSGCSSGVHLHFEVHGSGTDPGPLLDPFDGPCNGFNPGSLWVDQPDYRVHRVNHLSTNSAAPAFPSCPTQETPNEKRIFSSGDTIYLITFLRDASADVSRQTRIRQPDGTLLVDETESTPATYDSSYWWWFWTGANPVTAGPAGRWSLEVEIDGTTRTRAFWVGALFADDFEDAHLGAWSATAP